MKCPFGEHKEIKEWDNDIAEHLVITKDSVNHIHVHGPLGDKDLIREFTETAWSHAGMEFPNFSPAGKLPPEQVIFKNRQAIGDILVMTCAVRDFKKAFPNTRVGVITTAAHIWDNNPYIDHQFKDEESILDVGPGTLTNQSNRNNRHHCNAFRVDIENKLGIRFDQGDIRPDIWMTKEEYERPPIIEGPYWIIIIGGEPGWTAKMYPPERFEEALAMLKLDVRFIQLGMSRHPYPHLENAEDWIGKTEDPNTGIRDLFNIFLHAQGSLGLVSMHMHLSAAFNNPCIVVAGAREPAWYTHYFGHQYLETTGCLPCAESKACWKCDVEICDAHEGKVPKCVDLIGPEEIANAVRRYYDGGRLQYGKKIKNTFFNNIVDERKFYIAPKPSDAPNKFGMDWGGANLTEKDWNFVLRILEDRKIQTVLQFGADLATLLLMNEIDRIVCYETDGEKMKHIRLVANNKVELRSWDGETIHEKLGQFDLAFVDGPPGGKNRGPSTKIASEHAEEVIQHDANREWERKWAEQFLDGEFSLVRRGGNRTAWWSKNPPGTVEAIAEAKGTVTLVSTARGWGGCARSITTIMKMLTDRNYRVTFIPFHGKYDRGAGIGSEFRDWLDMDGRRVVVGDYHDIKRACDVLFVYADDYIWEFNRPDLVREFSDMNAKRKVMMLNYRRGAVGEIEWTKGWDKYMFLNSTQEKELLSVLPKVKTKVLPPCTILDDFLKIEVDYGPPLRIVRHNSQGDVKFRKDEKDAERFKKEVEVILACRDDVEIHFMPGPTFIPPGDRLFKYPRNVPPIPEFLAKGNLFWYSLPKGYADMGPRVVLEAMASGIPVIADNRDGPKDRITPETGWLCDTKEQHIEIIKNMTYEELEKKGRAAREWAKKEFVAERWIEEVLGEK